MEDGQSAYLRGLNRLYRGWIGRWRASRCSCWTPTVWFRRRSGASGRRADGAAPAPGTRWVRRPGMALDFRAAALHHASHVFEHQDLGARQPPTPILPRPSEPDRHSGLPTPDAVGGDPGATRGLPRAVRRFGGDTVCVEVNSPGQRLIIDGGTASGCLGELMGGPRPRQGELHVLLTHFHWDQSPALLPAVHPGSRSSTPCSPNSRRCSRISSKTVLPHSSGLGADVLRALERDGARRIGDIAITLIASTTRTPAGVQDPARRQDLLTASTPSLRVSRTTSVTTCRLSGRRPERSTPSTRSWRS
jgi:hypothetical protein